jgi:hypothetical protein
MDEDVDPAVALAPLGEDVGDLLVGLDVAWFDESRAEARRQRPNPLV